MLTIGIIAQKGGAGKTTLALGLGVEMQRRRGATLIVDVDPQGSASTWGDSRGHTYPLVTPTHATRLARAQEVARAGGAARMLIDTPARMAEAALAAARCSDLVVIPCTPSAQDLSAIAATIELARIARKPTVVVLNRAPVNNPLVGAALEAISVYRVASCPVIVHQRIDHVHAFAAGRSAAETAPRSKAAEEMRQLESWMQRHHGKAQPPG